MPNGQPPMAIAIELDGHDFHERTKEQATRDKSVIAHSYPPAGQSFDSLALRLSRLRPMCLMHGKRLLPPNTRSAEGVGLMKPFAMAEPGPAGHLRYGCRRWRREGRAVALELLAGLRALGGWQAFHPDIHRSSRGGAAARQARYRARKRDAADVTGSVTSGVTQTITSDATDRNAELVSALLFFLLLVRNIRILQRIKKRARARV